MKVLGKLGWNWREETLSDFSSERGSKIYRLAVPVLKSIQNLVIFDVSRENVPSGEGRGETDVFAG